VIIHGHVLVGWLGGVNRCLGGGPLLLLVMMLMLIEVVVVALHLPPNTSMLAKFDDICIVGWYVLILNDSE
jgi:hypothetical protein